MRSFGALTSRDDLFVSTIWVSSRARSSVCDVLGSKPMYIYELDTKMSSC